MSKESDYVECPVDDHKCYRYDCVEFSDLDDKSAPELACTIASRELVSAAKSLGTVNSLLRVYDVFDLSTEDWKNAMDMTPAIIGTAEKLGVDQLGFIFYMTNLLTDEDKS